MIILTFVCCVAVFVSSILIYDIELNEALYNKIDVAQNIIEEDIIDLKEKVYITATAMKNHQEISDSLKNKDYERVAGIAGSLRNLTQLDFCTVVDSTGIVITRVHDPSTYGDDLSGLPHVKSALEGRIESFIVPGVTIRLGIMAGAPIYDNDNNIIGAISLGYRLDSHEFVDKIKRITGAEISIFMNDERIASTAFNEGTDENDLYAKINHEISDRVLNGETYTVNIKHFGRDAIARYTPLHGANNEIIGMLSIGFYTADESDKITWFFINGILATVAVLIICFIVAGFISKTIDTRMNKMTKELNTAHNTAIELNTELFDTNAINELQLIMLNTVVKAAKIALWDFEITGAGPINYDNPVKWSDDFKYMIGFSEDDYFPDVLRSWSDRIHIGERLDIMNAFAEHISDASGNTLFNAEFQFLKKNGEYSYYRVAGNTIRDHEGRAVHFAGALLDITETKELQYNLERESTTLQAIFDSIPDMIFCKDISFNYIQCNKSFLHYFNTNESDIIGEDDVSGLKIPLNFAKEYRARDFYVINQDVIVTDEEYIPDHNGNLRLFETIKVPLKQKGHIIGLLGIAREITERKAMEDAAQSASRSKSLFLANMSHEIRTPMNSIIGFSELAQDDDIKESTKEYLSKIQESAVWLLEIINDILDISKIESGKIEFEKIPFTLYDIFEYCQSAITPKASEKNISLYCYAEPTKGQMLLGDPIRLRQVILNLLSNAVKFTNEGSVKLSAVITDTSENRMNISFEIKDTGIGMNPEQIEKIFDPFTQADDSITRRFGGTGLGLSITKNIIELMGSKLHVESKSGIGSVFFFDLKFDIFNETIIIHDKVVESHFEKPIFVGEVLVFEDNVLNQQVISLHLSKVGIEAVVVGNGKEGLDLIAKRIKNNGKPFDLIFMDIHMPVMDGLTAASELMNMGIRTPVVALTANIMSNDLELYKKSGIYDTLGKPYTSQELWRCLLKYLPVESYITIDEKRQSDDNEVFSLISSNFVRNNQTTYDDIISALNLNNIKTAHRIAHTLKSTAGQLGETTLQLLAADVEKCLADGKNNLNAEQLKKLETELKQVLVKYAAFVNDPSQTETLEELDIDSALKVLNELEPLLIKKDTKCIKFIKQLRNIPNTNDLIFFIQGFKFKQALVSFETLKKELISDE